MPWVPAMRDWILHVDLDQFLAAVEILRRPELAGRPVVVGGDGDPSRPRQVVATASYEARAFGVRSGMPLAAAARRCPDAVFLPIGPPRLRRGVRAGDGHAADASPSSSRCGDGTRPSSGPPATIPRRLARAIKERVVAETGLTCAVGIGETKLQAKTATGFAKPGGVARLTSAHVARGDGGPAGHRASGASAPAPRPRLEELGMRTVRELLDGRPPRAGGARSARRSDRA